ncbi:MAG: hypothetical protein GXP15_10670 [Gammaproteobacteria bacterium]|nr:hypothetical protein [Gammaproteobacteria bacterium]
MKLKKWKTVAELTGIAAIVISLVFVGVQLQQDRDLAQVSSFGSTAESANALSELVQSSSGVWVRGLNGEELTDEELAVFMSVIRAVESRYMNFIVRWQASSDERLDSEIHARIFAYYIYMYPGLRRVSENEIKFGKHRDTAFGLPSKGVPLYEMASPYLKQLDEAAPEFPIDKNYVIW